MNSVQGCRYSRGSVRATGFYWMLATIAVGSIFQLRSGHEWVKDRARLPEDDWRKWAKYQRKDACRRRRQVNGCFACTWHRKKKLTYTRIAKDCFSVFDKNIWKSQSHTYRFGRQLTTKRMKIGPYCQRQRCKTLNVLFDIMFFALICRRFL